MNPAPVFNICLFTADNKTQSISFNYFNSLFESESDVIINTIPKNQTYNISSYKLKSITIYFHSLKHIKEIDEETINEEELKKMLDDFLKNNYPFTIDFLFIVYSETMIKQINILTKKWDKSAFLIFPMDSKDFNDHPHKNKFQMIDINLIPSLLDLIKINYYWGDEYKLFDTYSKEHYYSTFALYSKRREELSLLSKEEQIKTFNDFEKFSFDYDYCPDDSLILIQIFDQNKDILSLDLKTNLCGRCNSRQRICSFHQASLSYRCDNCIGQEVDMTNGKCHQCNNMFQMAQVDKYLVTLCCKLFVCVKCYKEQINTHTGKAIEQKNWSLIKCYCGNAIDSFVIQFILGESNYQSLSKNIRK